MDRNRNLRQDLPYVTIAFIAANVLLFFAAETTGSTEDTDVLIRWGGAYTPYITDGQYWRLFTAMFMHSGIRHLLNNMLLLYVLGSNLEALLGRVKYFVLYLAGGFIGNFVSYYFNLRENTNVVSVGASGAIFAVMGAVIFIVLRNHGRVRNLTITQMLVMLAFSLYFGFVATNVANTAHIGGLISGFLLSVLLYRKPADASI